MSDILKRLRAEPTRRMGWSTSDRPRIEMSCDCTLIDEAADEIERLRAECDKAVAECCRLNELFALKWDATQSAETEAMRDEIARLRASLLRVLGGPPRPGGEEMSNIIRRLQVWDNAGWHKFITLTRHEIAELLVEIERVRVSEFERLREQAEIERCRHLNEIEGERSGKA